MVRIVTDAYSLRRDNSTQQHFSQASQSGRIAVDEVELLEILKPRVDLITQTRFDFVAEFSTPRHRGSPWVGELLWD
jgi:hypothetical protein